MRTIELSEQLKQLSNTERLEVIELATRLIREDLSPDSRGSEHSQWEEAALAVRDLYEPGGELTEWTDLDAEEFADENVPR